MDRRIALALLLPAAGFYLSVVPLTAMGADVAVEGKWTVNLKSPYRTRDTTMQLEQKGTEISGTIADSAGTQVPLTGSIKGNAISLTYELTGIRVNGVEHLMLKFTGTVDGDKITAKADQPVVGVLDMKATKK